LFTTRAARDKVGGAVAQLIARVRGCRHPVGLHEREAQITITVSSRVALSEQRCVLHGGPDHSRPRQVVRVSAPLMTMHVDTRIDLPRLEG
jgi:hypothetical protein